MSGIMMGSIASYPKVSSGSVQFGTISSYILTTGITAPGTDACTYEFWYYATSLGGVDNVTLNSWTGATGRDGAFITMFSTQYFLLGPGTNITTSPFGAVTNTWVHVAATFVSGGGTNNAKIWINGVNKATGTFSSLTSTELALGGRFWQGMIGYISNFRYVKGVQVYTGTFTPPTSPLTVTQSSGTNISAITAGQTQLLLNTATAGTYLTDSSSYARTMTPTGTISYSSLNPFS